MTKARCDIKDCRRESVCKVSFKTNPEIEINLCNECLQRFYFSLAKLVVPELKGKLENKKEKNK